MKTIFSLKVIIKVTFPWKTCYSMIIVLARIMFLPLGTIITRSPIWTSPIWWTKNLPTNDLRFSELLSPPPPLLTLSYNGEEDSMVNWKTSTSVFLIFRPSRRNLSYFPKVAPNVGVPPRAPPPIHLTIFVDYVTIFTSSLCNI